jgi:alpha-tubulin suppressor-like RCC1 family protein
VSRRRIAELQGDGASVGELDVLGKHFLVISTDGTIVTVGKLRAGTKGRRYRRW